MASEEVDCISELPDEIVTHILSYLPVADAFSFKLVSRRWSRIQVPLSNIYFSDETIFGKTIFFEGCSNLEKLKSEFVDKVDGFLNLFRGPYLNTFMVDFCLDNESAPAIDKWVSFAVSMQVESIELAFNNTNSQTLYKFPFDLLPEPKPFTRLKRLKLSACSLLLTPESPPPFNCLKTLELKNLPLDQTSLDGVLSSCLDLEWLTLEECEWPRTLCVSSAGLRGLRVHHHLPTSTIELNATQLQTIDLKGRALKLSFLVVPPLERVHLAFLNPYAAKIFFDLLPAEVRPKFQILSLKWFTANSIHARIPEFSCLKQLDFFSPIYREFDLLSITNLLNACPMLQKIHLNMNISSRHSESRIIEKVEYSNNMKYLHLEEIEISRFRGTSNQMKLVIYLLNNAVALKLITLIYSQCESHDYKWRNVEHLSQSKLLSEKQVHELLCKVMISHGAELIIC
ncbi:putative F-box/FBD/LRR-repeat protein At5g56810 isoform X1 [Argentina anserina]|uniref:putative F-box/FBD/LRR-repeat protein At5g56810 isoform X1 n=1 Tax=Argentina anserina TaxID=57926 RepID=UPI0021766683|nr:putative F-box/FBD/LRR-repeat protein At5g56810 isoform X1 [Potentilla anserina]